jgi:hypothetical protein
MLIAKFYFLFFIAKFFLLKNCDQIKSAHYTFYYAGYIPLLTANQMF